MSYQSATTSAPADADFVVYRNDLDYVFVQRREGNSWDVIAETDAIGYALVLVGISAARMSLWHHNLQQFLSGNFSQMLRDEQEPAA